MIRSSSILDNSNESVGDKKVEESRIIKFSDNTNTKV